MLQAYIDESGKGAKDGYFVMAGYIAPAEVWAEKFVPAWQKILDLRPPHHSRIESFKMSEMFGDLERCGWFYRVIEETVTAAVSCTISIPGLEKAFREFPWPFLMSHTEALTNPYYFGFKAITDMLAQHQSHLKITEPVDFIFDDAREKKNCIEAWETLKLYSRPDVRELMGDTPIFRDDKTTLPLQAADLYAYWVRDWESKGISDGIEKLSFPWKPTRDLPRIDFKFEEKDFIIEFNKVFDPDIRKHIDEPGTKFTNPSPLDFYRPLGSSYYFSQKDSKKMDINSLPILNKDSLRSVYSNNVNTAIGPWDLRLIFTEIVQDSKGEFSQELKANVVMSPTHARAFLGSLSTAIEQHERQFGKIIQPNPPGENKE